MKIDNAKTVLITNARIRILGAKKPIIAILEMIIRINTIGIRPNLI